MHTGLSLLRRTRAIAVGFGARNAQYGFCAISRSARQHADEQLLTAAGGRRPSVDCRGRGSLLSTPIVGRRVRVAVSRIERSGDRGPERRLGFGDDDADRGKR